MLELDDQDVEQRIRSNERILGDRAFKTSVSAETGREIDDGEKAREASGLLWPSWDGSNPGLTTG